MSIDLEHVREVTKKAYVGEAYRRLKGRERVAVFIRHTPLKAGTDLRIGYNRYKVEKDAFLVFVDLRHEANFAHPVLFELHDVEDGSVRTIEDEFPLADPALERSLIPHLLPVKEGK